MKKEEKEETRSIEGKRCIAELLKTPGRMFIATSTLYLMGKTIQEAGVETTRGLWIIGIAMLVWTVVPLIQVLKERRE